MFLRPPKLSGPLELQNSTEGLAFNLYYSTLVLAYRRSSCGKDDGMEPGKEGWPLFNIKKVMRYGTHTVLNIDHRHKKLALSSVEKDCVPQHAGPRTLWHAQPPRCASSRMNDTTRPPRTKSQQAAIPPSLNVLNRILQNRTRG